MNSNLGLGLSFIIIKYFCPCRFILSRKLTYDAFEIEWEDVKVQLEKDQKDCDKLFASLVSENGADGLGE